MLKVSMFALIISLCTISCNQQQVAEPAPLSWDQPVKGWMILSDNKEEGLYVIENAARYDINHLQISHEVIHSLRQVRDDERRELANIFIRAAHKAGIQEVVLWDHALNDLDYYPDQFKTGPGGTIDLDNPDFWEWFQNDYRELLDMVPDIQGLILTFIETGAREEFRTPSLMQKTRNALNRIPEVAARIENYPHYVQGGQWNWVEDADQAMWYYETITEDGWPEETDDIPVLYGGMTFPLEAVQTARK